MKFIDKPVQPAAQPVSTGMKFVDKSAIQNGMFDSTAPRNTFGEKVVGAMDSFNKWAGGSDVYNQSSVQQFAAPTVGLFSGLGKVAEKTTGSAMDWAGKKLFNNYQPIAGSTESVTSKLLGSAKQGGAFQVGEIVGKNIPSTLATAGIMGPTGNLVPRILKGAAGGAVSTQANTLLTEGRLATPQETLIGAGIGSAFGGLSNVASKKQLEKYVMPKMTPSEEEFRASQGLKKSNIFGKISVLPTKQEKDMAKIAQTIGINPSKTVVKNINRARSAEDVEANNLRKLVEANPFNFSKKIVNSNLNKIEIPLSIKGDTVMENKFNNVKKAFMDIYGGQPKKNAIGLLDGRKEFDTLVKREFPNLYSSEADTPIKLAVQAIRKIPNTLINDKIGGNAVADSLKKQTNIMSIIENLSSKSEKGGTSSISRFIQNNKGKLGAAAGGIGTYLTVKSIIKGQQQ